MTARIIHHRARAVARIGESAARSVTSGGCCASTTAHASFMRNLERDGSLSRDVLEARLIRFLRGHRFGRARDLFARTTPGRPARRTGVAPRQRRGPRRPLRGRTEIDTLRSRAGGRRGSVRAPHRDCRGWCLWPLGVCSCRGVAHSSVPRPDRGRRGPVLGTNCHSRIRGRRPRLGDAAAALDGVLRAARVACGSLHRTPGPARRDRAA